MTAQYTFKGLGPGYILLDNNGVASVVKLNNPSFGFNALALPTSPPVVDGANGLVDGVTTIMPFGSSTLTSYGTFGDQPLIMTSSGIITTMYAQHTGRGSNVGGQTLQYDLYHDNSLVAAARITGLAAGPDTGSVQGVSFFSEPYNAGDTFSIRITPVGTLTATVYNICTSIG